MTESEREKFNELYEKVRNLETFKCRLTHERVQIENSTGLPITRQIPENIYDRIGLCPYEIRSKRVSCGHTMAHIPMLDAIKILESEGRIDQLLSCEFDTELNKIYQLDHKKGFAESDLAVLIEMHVNGSAEFSETDLINAENAIREIEVQHDECVEGIRKIHTRVVAEMQKLIDEF